MKRFVSVVTFFGFVAMISLTMGPSPVFASFGVNSLTGTGGMKTMGAVAGTKVNGTVFVEYFDYFTKDKIAYARARVAVRLILNNDIAIFYCDNYDPQDNPPTYCYNGIKLVQSGGNWVGRTLEAIVVPAYDIPAAQVIITNAVKAIILKRFFNNNQNLGIYMKSITNGVDTTSPTFTGCGDNWFEPGCTPGIYPWPNPVVDSVNLEDQRNIFMFDFEIAVK